MNRRRFLESIGAAAASLVAGGCAHYQTLSEGDEDTVMTVRWRYTPGKCKAGMHSCSDVTRHEDGRAECLVYTPRPLGFDDVRVLESAGHELWHCQGARHQP